MKLFPKSISSKLLVVLLLFLLLNLSISPDPEATPRKGKEKKTGTETEAKSEKETATKPGEEESKEEDASSAEEDGKFEEMMMYGSFPRIIEKIGEVLKNKVSEVLAAIKIKKEDEWKSFFEKSSVVGILKQFQSGSEQTGIKDKEVSDILAKQDFNMQNLMSIISHKKAEKERKKAEREEMKKKKEEKKKKKESKGKSESEESDKESKEEETKAKKSDKESKDSSNFIERSSSLSLLSLGTETEQIEPTVAFSKVGR